MIKIRILWNYNASEGKQGIHRNQHREHPDISLNVNFRTIDDKKTWLGCFSSLSEDARSNDEITLP